MPKEALSRTLAVSRSWAAAVRSMKPIHATIQRCDDGSTAFHPLPPVARIVASPLLRHLAAIHIEPWTPLGNASLGLLAQHAPNLTSLDCELKRTPNAPLILPPKLTWLTLQLGDEFADESVNDVLTALAALPLLSNLCLYLSQTELASVDLRLLGACPSLAGLTLETSQAESPELTHTQLDQIRSSLGHLQRIDVGCLGSNHLARLLHPPVTAQWQDIGFVDGDARTGELLLRLPTLTKLHLDMGDQARIKFLSQLPLLTSLELDRFDEGNDGINPPAAVVASLGRCTGLTELSLAPGFNSPQLAALFAKLMQLRKLMIRTGGPKTLRCFASGPITQSLEELSLTSLHLPPSELPHLYALRRLRTLHLSYCFSPRLSDATVDSLTPPTPILPALTKFGQLWRGSEDDDDAEDDDTERRGPSFEWMQARAQ